MPRRGCFGKQGRVEGKLFGSHHNLWCKSRKSDEVERFQPGTKVFDLTGMAPRAVVGWLTISSGKCLPIKPSAPTIRCTDSRKWSCWNVPPPLRAKVRAGVEGMPQPSRLVFGPNINILKKSGPLSALIYKRILHFAVKRR